MRINVGALALSLAILCSTAQGNESSTTSTSNAALAAVTDLIQRVSVGDTNAMNALGNLYLQGEGVPQDSVEAIQLFKKAVELGNADGAMNLGRAYFRGRGIQPNQKESIYWFKAESAIREGRTPPPVTPSEKADPRDTLPTPIGSQTCRVQVPPEIPKLTLKTGKGGRVKAQALIIGGKIRDVSILSGPKIFHDKVVAAMLQYQCDPSKADILGTQEFVFFVTDNYGAESAYRVEWADKWSRVEEPAFNADWLGLTMPQRRVVRARYGNLPTTYEPPYPINGLGALVEDIRVYAEHWGWKGKFSLDIVVNAGGAVTGVSVFEAPTDKAKEYAASVAFNAKFKPPMCEGKPCEMVFPINIEIVQFKNEKSSGQLEARAEKGDAAAQNAMGERYEYGRGVEKDFKVALDWYRKSADQKFLDGQNNLARLLETGRGTEKNYPEAIALYRAAAEKGYAPSQSNYGYMLAHGRGAEVDHTEAVKWFEQAAAQGYALGQYNLAGAYLKGQGVNADVFKAQALYQVAMDNGNKASPFMLVLLHFLQLGEVSKVDEAMQDLSISATLGNAASAAILGVSYSRGAGVPQNDEKAFQMFTKSAEGGNKAGLYLLADSYEKGRGTPQNQALALSWYEKAAAQGNALAMMRMSELFAQGKGVPKNLEKSKSWDSKAREKRYTTEFDDLMQVILFNRVAERDSNQTLVRYRDATRNDAQLVIERIDEITEATTK